MGIRLYLIELEPGQRNGEMSRGEDLCDPLEWFALGAQEGGCSRCSAAELKMRLDW